jgi:hypothetical protein
MSAQKDDNNNHMEVSKEDIQVDNAKKMLEWVKNNNNKIARSWAAKGTEERVIGQWWNIAKSLKGDYVEKYPGVKVVLFGVSAAQKVIEDDYNETIILIY